MTFFDRITAGMICIVSAFFFLSGCMPRAAAMTYTPDFAITSKAAVMMNIDKDVIVYEKNADKKMYPASLTKIVTAMVVLDNVPADELESTYFEAPLSVFDELYGTGASAVGLTKGEITTVKDLLYSLLLKSACESAGILAYNIGGQSTQNFVAMMNNKAKEIGCSGTHFVNAHGLFDKNQFTNAHDMAKIVKYALDYYPKLVEIACTVDYQMQPTNVHGEGWAHIYHTNSMVNPDSYEYYPYVKGFKTGTLDECGRNLATLGEKDGSRYLLVTLGSPQTDEEGNTVYDHYDDHRELYEWAFEHLSYKTIVEPGTELSELQVKFGGSSDFVRLVTGEEYSCVWSDQIDPEKIGSKIEIDEEKLNPDGTVNAPIEQGDKYGSYSLFYEVSDGRGTRSETICTVDLVTQRSVTLSPVDYNVDRAKSFLTSGWFILAVIIALLLVIAYIAIVITAEKKRRQRIRRVNRDRKF